MGDPRQARHYWKNRETRLAANNEWRANNRERLKRYAQIKNLSSYGLTPESYNNVIELQGNKCPICQRPFDGNRIKPCIDHDHDNLSFRWIICQRCNKGLGWFDDNVQSLSRAISYVDSFKSNPRAIKAKNRPKK